ncbi:MAG: hypothetical protein H0W83_04550 [Planctomycetes bacterium]|nr:hypothetical protein [Planctomycetota bacterium]
MRTDLRLVEDWTLFHKLQEDPAAEPVACRLSGELFPYQLPALDPLLLLDQARRHPLARILSQKPDRRIDVTATCGERVKSMPLAQVAEDPHLHLSLFAVEELRAPAGALHALEETVMAPMARAWHANRIRWEGPFTYVIFITGRASATNYHIDPMPTLPWNLFGAKRFHGLKDPLRWYPARAEAEATGGEFPLRPEGITEDDCVVHDNRPGDLVWIPGQTPHWVDAGSFSATLTFILPKMRIAGREMVAVG